MLPAIYFIFSRAACDEAVRSALLSGVKLTVPTERTAISTIVESKITGLSAGDLEVLDYQRFLAALRSGFASHHAGMVPPFKEAVEECFVEGLVKVVFATETLALGINMPARTVVVEKLTKFGGERHQFLTPGEYTQLTGRAGRRGIDNVGYAAALWSPVVDFEQVASLAARRTYELRSSFRPTNNMAVNLVRRYGPDEAHHLLALSFAQYRIDTELQQTHARVERLRQEVREARTAAYCEHGDIGAFVRRSEWAATSPRADEAEVAGVLDGLRPGDVLGPSVQGVAVRGTPVIGLDPARSVMSPGNPEGAGSERSERPGALPGDGWSVVIATARRRDRPTTLRVVTANARLLSLTPRDFRAVPTVVGQIRLPSPFNPNSRSFQQQAANALTRVIARKTGPTKGSRNKERAADERHRNASADPLLDCPDVAAHLSAYHRAQRVANEIDRVTAATRDRENSLTDQFDAVLQMLEELAYLHGWSVTPMGDMLAGLFHESDLLVAECLRDGVLDGLAPADLAALVSCFVFEERGPGSRISGRGRGPVGYSRQRSERRPAGDRGSVRDRAGRPGDLPADFPKPLSGRFWTMCAIAGDLNGLEAELGLPLTKELSPGFVAIARKWAAGRDLHAALEDSDVTGGDFVRTIRILIDLLRQIGEVAPDPATAKAARQGADNLFRGVVSATSIKDPSDQPEQSEPVTEPDGP